MTTEEELSVPCHLLVKFLIVLSSLPFYCGQDFCQSQPLSLDFCTVSGGQTSRLSLVLVFLFMCIHHSMPPSGNFEFKNKHAGLPWWSNG